MLTKQFKAAKNTTATQQPVLNTQKPPPNITTSLLNLDSQKFFKIRITHQKVTYLWCFAFLRRYLSRLQILHIPILFLLLLLKTCTTDRISHLVVQFDAKAFQAFTKQAPVELRVPRFRLGWRVVTSSKNLGIASKKSPGRSTLERPNSKGRLQNTTKASP